MSFFEELRRRNVFRVAIAYIVTAWLLAQVADLAFDNFGTPDWVPKTVLFLLVLGFPLAVFFAWVFELTPEGIKREHEVNRSASITGSTGRKLDRAIIGILAVAIVFLLWERFTGDDTVTEAPATAAATSDGKPSIAILPFENRSAREEDRYFTDGIHDELLTTLANIGSMKVISRTSVMEYRDTIKKIPEIATELGVTTILEGGVQRAGDQVRINVQLINAASDEHLWAEVYDRELTAENLFKIQSEVSRAVADALHAALSPEDAARVDAVPTLDTVAYEAYLRGRELWRQRRAASTTESVEWFLDAVQRDPNFALAWAGLADAYRHQAVYAGKPWSEMEPLAAAASERALALNPQLGEAYASRGALHMNFGRFDAAQADFQRALELNPNYAMAWNWYGMTFNGEGRLNEAKEAFENGLELDPTSPQLRANLSWVYGWLGQAEAAREGFKRLIDIAPESPTGYKGMAVLTAHVDRRPVDALAWAKQAAARAPGNPEDEALRAMLLLDLNDIEGARRVLAELRTEGENWVLLPLARWRLSHMDGDADRARNTARQLSAEMPSLRGLIGPLLQFALEDLESGDDAAAIEHFFEAYPEFKIGTIASVNHGNAAAAIAFAYLLQKTGSGEDAKRYLERTVEVLRPYPPAAIFSPHIEYVTALTLLGRRDDALAELARSVELGPIPGWQWLFDDDPRMEALREEPEFQRLRQVTAQQAAAQRAELESRRESPSFEW